MIFRFTSGRIHTLACPFGFRSCRITTSFCLVNITEFITFRLTKLTSALRLDGLTGHSKQSSEFKSIFKFLISYFIEFVKILVNFGVNHWVRYRHQTARRRSQVGTKDIVVDQIRFNTNHYYSSRWLKGATLSVKQLNLGFKRLRLCKEKEKLEIKFTQIFKFLCAKPYEFKIDLTAN